MVAKVLFVYSWQLPEQFFSSATVYRIRGLSTFLCASGLNVEAWHPAQSGLYALNFHAMTSLLVVWHDAQITPELWGL